MRRALRLLAAISFIWMVGSFVLAVTDGSRYPFTSSFAIYAFVASLCGELVFAVGLLALVATASRRHVGWCALFALLLALLHVLPLLIFRTPPYPNFLALFAAPLELFGRNTWVVLLPALIPGMALFYTLIAEDGRPVVAEDEETHPSLTS